MESPTNNATLSYCCGRGHRPCGPPLYHCKAEHDIYLTSGLITKQKLISIKEGLGKLGKYVCENILFAHAFSGCDTVPQPFNIAKTLLIKRLEKGDSIFCDVAHVFLDPSSSSQDVIAAGEKAFVGMYGGKASSRLIYCVLSFTTKISVRIRTRRLFKLKTFLLHQQLQVSSLNVSHQMQEWATLGQPRLNPGDWRWDLQDDGLMPMMTDLDPVPKYLLKVIRCCFKQDFSTSRCSCKKHGLICTQACKERRGTCCLDSYLVKIQQI